MWIYANPNPKNKHVNDCVIRAVSIALNQSWYQTSDEIYSIAREDCDVTPSDVVWGRYLYLKGFEPFVLCPKCLSIREFADMFAAGVYIIGTGDHAVCVIDGNYYDTWDSGDQIATYFWVIS